MKHATKILAALLLVLAMVVGLVPGMSLTAYAETTTVTWSSTDAAFPGLPNGISVTGVNYGDENGLYSTGDKSFSTTLGNFTKIEVTGGWLESNTFGGNGWSGRTWTGDASTVSYSGFLTDRDHRNPWTITFTIEPTVTNYDLWVGGTRVTSDNAGNIDGHNKASYDHQTKTLTLNNYSYSGAGSTANGASGSDAAITTSENLNIVITGTNSVKGTTCSSGIYVSGNLTISGTGSLTAEGKNFGISNEGGSVRISSGTMTAIGESYAIYGSLRNDIAGTGWTDTAGTQGKAGIAISDTGRYFTNYKKIQFPAVPDSSMVATAPTGKSLSHNAQPQPLVNPGTASGGTMEYALGKDDVTAPTDGWSTDVPTATEPGTYYVWYRVVGDENHNDVAPACVVVTITPAAAGTASDSDYTLLASMKTSGNKAFKLKWTAVSGAEGYDVFFGDCGGGECTLEKTVTGTSCKIGKLKKGNAYKAFVKAWKTENGQKVYIGQASPDVHAVAGGKSNKYTNAKKITVKKKNLTIAVGGSKKIKASLKKFSNSRRYLNHTAKIRYFSSNRTVATVNAKGKVTGVAPGTCTVYAVAENGLRKGVKITVK